MQKSTSPERIPREALHDQHERLTTNHIQTLSFMQDIANENKQLKARVEQLELIQKEYETLQEMSSDSKDRIKQIQQEYLQHADEINAMLAEKHKNEILELVDEKIEIERKSAADISDLKSHIERLQQTNRDMMLKNNNISTLEDQNKLFQEELDRTREENDELKLECARLQQPTRSQSDLHHVQGLKSQNEALNQQIRELNQKRDELEFRISKLEQELHEKSKDGDKITLIDNLRTKLEKIHKEKTEMIQKISNYENEITNLKIENENLKDSLVKLDREKQNILIEFQKVCYELQALRKQMSKDQDKKAFKDFVMVKRELNVLKEENQVLRHRNRLTVEKLPFLKDDRPKSATKVSEMKNKKKPLSLPSSKSDTTC